MIRAISEATPYKVQFTNGQLSAQADTTRDDGGRGDGFRPHELLEAALATCANIIAMMYAKNHAIPLVQAVVKVTLDRSGSEKVVFNHEVELKGDLTTEQKQAVMSAIRACPVRKTLLRGVSFADE